MTLDSRRIARVFGHTLWIIRHAKEATSWTRNRGHGINVKLIDRPQLRLSHDVQHLVDFSAVTIPDGEFVRRDFVSTWSEVLDQRLT